jgi:N-acetylmuramoyl-L-alanine amidase
MPTQTFASVNDGIKYFVGKYKNDLVSALSGSGIYFAVAVGQKCTESGFGTSDLATKYNNFGGIMNFGSLPNAGTVTLGGKHYATFATPKDCFIEYVNILKDPTKKYISKGLLNASTPQGQLLAIANGGYCEAPPPGQYYTQVVKMVDKCLGIYSIGKIS